MQEIRITDIENVRLGNAENQEAGTGCTVVICEQGAPTGMDVRGGGPASRESELLKPMAAVQAVHAVLFSGGSAFGLDAAGGVMQYLEEHNIGFDVEVTKVPLVCQSSLFDLCVGDAHVRPDKAMGYQACANAFLGGGNYQDGNHGAGTGATLGRLHGMKSGIGSYAVQIGELKIGGVVAVNAFGDIYNWKTGKKIAGWLAEDGHTLLDTETEFYKSYAVDENKFVNNTNLGVVITNARFNKTQLCKIAGMGHDGYARAIRPVHTSADGDTIYAMSVGTVEADQDVVGALAAHVMSEAILRAVLSAEGAYGLPAARDL